MREFCCLGGGGGVALPFSEETPFTLALNLLSPTQVNVAPLLNGLALLGEAGKVTAVSSYRFASISVDNSTSGLSVDLRGGPGELVTLLWAQNPSLIIQTKSVTLGGDGFATVTVP